MQIFYAIFVKVRNVKTIIRLFLFFTLKTTMPDKEKIYSLDLIYNGAPAPFVIKTMEEIDKALGGIADNPHTHNYYTVIWPVNATGKHIIDFKEYDIPVSYTHLTLPT